ncbi:MAG: pyruvate kinase, partial [Atopobiaceae bacterium]
MGSVRRAKIVCTLGPAVSSPERMEELVNAGMNVARLNMSHGDYAEHEKR